MSREWLFTSGPATVDTSTKTSIRWASTVAATGAIALSNYLFQLPAFTLPLANRQEGQYIIYQLNFTAPSKFTIFNYLDVVRQLPTSYGNNDGFFVCIRYCVGNVVTRYLLNQFTPIVNGFQSNLWYPLYKGQVIMPQFSIEVWNCNNFLGFLLTPTLRNAITFITSIKATNIPPAGLQTDITLSPVSTAIGDIGVNPLSFALPMNNPQVQNPIGPFNSN